MKSFFKVLIITLALSALVQTIVVAKVNSGSTNDSAQGHGSSEPTI